MNWYTRLNAEDGIYYKQHSDEDSAKAYITYQFGECLENPYQGVWSDGFGRTMSIHHMTEDDYRNMVYNEVRFVQES